MLRANSTQEKGWYHLSVLIVLSPTTFSSHVGKQVKKLLEVRSTLQAPLCEFTPMVLHPVKRHFCVRKHPRGSAVSTGFTSFLSPQDLLRPWGVKSVQRRQQNSLDRNQRDEAAVISCKVMPINQKSWLTLWKRSSANVMQARLMAIILLSNERKETWSTQCLSTLEKIKFLYWNLLKQM